VDAYGESEQVTGFYTDGERSSSSFRDGDSRHDRDRGSLRIETGEGARFDEHKSPKTRRGPLRPAEDRHTPALACVSALSISNLGRSQPASGNASDSREPKYIVMWNRLHSRLVASANSLDTLHDGHSTQRINWNLPRRKLDYLRSRQHVG